MMDLERLRSLIAVLEAGTISEAARRRHLSQPAVSLQIQALEEEFGAALLSRRGRGVAPTQAGEILALRGREALETLQAARAEISGLQGLMRGRFRMGLTDAAATDILPATFPEFHSRYPGIDVQVTIADTSDVVRGLKQGGLDVGIGTASGRALESGVLAFPVAEDPMYLAAPAEAAASSVEAVTTDQPFIAYPRGSRTRIMLDAALQEAGLTVRPTMEIGRPDVMVRLVEAGVGIALLPHAVLKPALERGSVVLLQPDSLAPKRELELLLPHAWRDEPVTRAYVEMLESQLSLRIDGPAGLQ